MINNGALKEERKKEEEKLELCSTKIISACVLLHDNILFSLEEEVEQDDSEGFYIFFSLDVHG